jgi:polyhydroxybutyrate depolymerase
VSVIAFNGLQDTYIPYEGGLMKKKLGEPVEMLSASDTLDFWVSANGCNTEAIVEKRKHSTRYTYGGGKNGTEVVQYAITNQGHAWPGGRSPDASADKPSRDVSANDLLWDFFASHPKP